MIARRAVITLPSARALAIDIFAPSGDATAATLVFSHGANAAPDRYLALLGGWVAAGHTVIAPLHLDSEDHPERETVNRGRILHTRIADMAAAVGLLRENAVPGLEAIVAAGVVAAGHSYGAYIAQIIGGASALDPDSGDRLSGPDASSVDAIIALSPPPIFDGFIPVGSWTDISPPMLVQTGTADIMPPFVVNWRQHLDSCREARPGVATACVYDAVDHYFGGVIGRVNPAAAPEMQAQLARFVRLSVLFMESVMAGECDLSGRSDLAALCDHFPGSPFDAIG